MMSTVLPSEPLLSHGNTNPLYGGFTPWENLEYFFNSTEIYDKPKPNLSCHNNNYADLVIGSDISNQKLSYHAEVNLDSYRDDSDLDLNGQNEKLPSFNDQLNPSHYYDGSALSSQSPNQHSDKNSNDGDQPTQNSPMSSSTSGGSDEPNENQNQNEDENNTVQGVMDERKRKRMISNRESARRSRMRKQKQVENLRNDVNELKIRTRERSNQLRLMTYHIHYVRRENDRLKAEFINLHRKLMELTQIWQLQRLQQQCSYHHPPPPPSAPSCTPMQIII